MIMKEIILAIRCCINSGTSQLFLKKLYYTWDLIRFGKGKWCQMSFIVEPVSTTRPSSVSSKPGNCGYALFNKTERRNGPSEGVKRTTNELTSI